MATLHKFTAIVITYNRPALLRAAVGALRRQSYENLEIILVNNGGTPETLDCLREFEAMDQRVKLVHFQENQFSWDDPLKMVDVCWNAGLELATGDYVWCQNDDDLIADDYAEKMVALFEGNKECTTAGGLYVLIDFDGNVIQTGPRVSNFRPRYMPGHLLALDCLRGGATMFSYPGTIFTVRRDALVNAGGYHRAIEVSQLYGIAPFGITGFDETALFYWRSHSGQLNKQLVPRGWTGGIDYTRDLLKAWEIERRWQHFGAAVAREVVSRLEEQAYQQANDGLVHFFINHAVSWKVPATMRIIRQVWRRGPFWSRVLVIVRRKGTLRLLKLPYWLVVKPLLQRARGLPPRTGSGSPRLARGHEETKRGAG